MISVQQEGVIFMQGEVHLCSVRGLSALLDGVIVPRLRGSEVVVFINGSGNAIRMKSRLDCMNHNFHGHKSM